MSSSRTQRRLRLALTLLLLLVMGGVSGMQAQEKDAAKKEGKGKARKEAKPAAEEEESAAKPGTNIPAAPTTGLLAFGKMLPVGQEHRELEIPSFKNGAPASMVQAKTMTRTDNENMFLKGMNIWMYGPPGQAEKDMRVQLRTATYHMPSNIIASDERSRISRSDFDLQGDTLIFDTVTGQGKMVGNVTMVLHDASSFTKSADDASAGEEKKKPRSQQDSSTKDTASVPSSPTASGQPAATATTPAAAPPGKPGTDTASPTNLKK